MGCRVANKNLEGYQISDIYEIIKLDFDEKGVKVENEGAIRMLKCAVKQPIDKKYIILDKTFWLIMKEGKNHPYLVARIEVPFDE